MRTDLALQGRTGKVRDVYRIPDEPGDAAPRVLMVASDRISAFDVVLPTPIAGKGRLLTEIAAFWLGWVESRGLCRTHLLSTDAADIPESAFTGTTTRQELVGRVTIGRACTVIPIECVVRGYLEGSGWGEYQASGTVCGVRLPDGLRRCDRLPEPIFTPATKAEDGAHDENISFERAGQLIGRDLIEHLRDVSVNIYTQAAHHALEHGILIADTKFEFGIPVDNPGSDPILIDEALTPDSSRFWPADDYEPGRTQRSFDKQFVREYLQTLIDAGRWDKADPGPELPDEIVSGTLDRYREARDRLTG